MSPDDVKAWRERLGLTQKAAAEALGLSYPHYRRLEAGMRFDQLDKPPPRPTKTVRLAMAALAKGLKDPWPDPPGPDEPAQGT